MVLRQAALRVKIETARVGWMEMGALLGGPIPGLTAATERQNRKEV